MTVYRHHKARYILIGGFLGAGKTTAVARLARYLIDRGTSVGIISNDQSTGLVDTAMLRGRGFSVAEVAGGCFCCRFDSLVEATSELAAESSPDVFLAEPVGSCTDLIATVGYPLRRLHGGRFTIAPLSVLVDPKRAARVLGIEQGSSFSEKVLYVYRKQLEEADFIIINKCDAVDGPARERLAAGMRQAFPSAEVLCCSARAGTGLASWFERLLVEERGCSATMEVDYDRYAEGEALLGWLNTTIRLTAKDAFDGNALLLDLADRIREGFRRANGEIAHLKMTLFDEDRVVPGGPACVVSLAGNDYAPHLCESLLWPISVSRLIINLRAETDPETLRRITADVLDECARSKRRLTVETEHLECFRPARPTPTHRIPVSG